jgi:kynureninase
LSYENSSEFARQADQDDPLRTFREAFLRPEAKDGHDCIYLCGNSLGLQPRLAADYVQQELEDW